MNEIPYYRSRLRVKGQVTVPGEIRNILGAEEGDELVFMVDENGRVIIERAQLIPPDQAWFWSERWQQMEHEAQSDLSSGRTREFPDLSSALENLDRLASGADAED